MNTVNRIYRNQPDYLLTIVRPSHGWVPRDVEDSPPLGEVVSQGMVASFEEAHDDLVRCNRLSLERGFSLWAVIHSAGTTL